MKDVALKQFRSYSNPKRDPRHRTITVAFYAIINDTSKKLVAGDDADAAHWFPVNNLPQMAFDHDTILNEFLNEMKINRQP